MVMYFVMRIGLDPLRPCDKRGWVRRNALMCACIGGHTSILAVLLLLPSLSGRAGVGEELDRVIETRDDYGYTALDYACQYHQADCVAMLTHAGVPLDSVKDKYKGIAKSLIKEAGYPSDYEWHGTTSTSPIENYGAKAFISRVNTTSLILGESLVPYVMGLSFLGTLSFSASHCDSMLTAISVVVQIVLCIFIIITKCTEPGIWLWRQMLSDEDKEEKYNYASWIRRECLRVNADFLKLHANTKDIKKYSEAMRGLEKLMKTHICHVCRCWRPAGARHSTKTQSCIEGYDHFCYFFGVDIGKKNQVWYNLAIIGFNIGIPLCLIDMAKALVRYSLLEATADVGVLSLPRLASSTVYHAIFNPTPRATPVILSVFCIWLALMWLFVSALGAYALYKRFFRPPCSKGSHRRDEKKKRKKE